MDPFPGTRRNIPKLLVARAEASHLQSEAQRQHAEAVAQRRDMRVAHLHAKAAATKARQDAQRPIGI